MIARARQLVFLGPPGAGKGTQAKRVADQFNLEHLATGDLLRDAVSRKLPLGIQAQQAMDRGALVSDELVLAIVDNKLGELDSQKGVLFDGFPRTIVQAQGLDVRLEQRGRMIERVVFFRVPDEAIVDRISGRLTCPLDGIPYHRAYHPPMVSGCCDKCGSTLVQRSDDEEIKVRSRLNAYRTSTAALLPYYASKGLLTEIDGEGTIDEVADRVNAALAG